MSDFEIWRAGRAPKGARKGPCCAVRSGLTCGKQRTPQVPRAPTGPHGAPRGPVGPVLRTGEPPVDPRDPKILDFDLFFLFLFLFCVFPFSKRSWTFCDRFWLNKCSKRRSGVHFGQFVVFFDQFWGPSRLWAGQDPGPGRDRTRAGTGAKPGTGLSQAQARPKPGPGRAQPTKSALPSPSAGPAHEKCAAKPFHRRAGGHRSEL